MASLAEYFEKNRPKAKFQFGDRVFGKYETILFIGTVGSDGLVNESIGPEVTVTLDLPLVIQGQIKSVLRVGRDSVKPLKEF